MYYDSVTQNSYKLVNCFHEIKNYPSNINKLQYEYNYAFSKYLPITQIPILNFINSKNTIFNILSRYLLIYRKKKYNDIIKNSFINIDYRY